jgi:hypothetical protein
VQYEKVISNIEEVRARGGKVIVVATEGDNNIRGHSDHVIYVPHALEPLAAAADGGAAAIAGVSRGGGAGVQRGQAEESGQERDGGIG